MASRRNSAVKIYVNGSTADSLYGLSRRMGQQVSRMSQAHTRAVSSLKRKVQPVATKAVREAYTIKASTLRGRTKVETGARKGSDFISLWASARKISLIDFGGRWSGVKSSGATAAIRLGQRKTYTHAFIAALSFHGKAANKAMYVRSRGPGGKPVGRGPLVRLYGPSVFDMVVRDPSGGSHSVRNAIVPQLESFYTTELTRQIALELRRG